MSLGFSAGDFVLAAQLAWKVLQNARRACDAQDDLIQEASNLHVVLRRVEIEVAKPETLTNRICDYYKEELGSIVQKCERWLKLLNGMLEKYNASGEKKRSAKKVWQRVKFGNGEVQDLDHVRLQLGNSYAAVNVYLSLMSSASQGRVEQMMRSHGGTLAEMLPFLNGIAGSLTARTQDEIILPSYSNDDSSVWKYIHRKLSAEGLLSSSIARHKDTIIAYIVELGDRGALDEVDVKTMKLEPAAGNVAAAAPKPMHLGAIQEDEEYCEDNGQDNDGSASMDSREEENLANVDVLSSRFSQDQYLNEYGASAFDSDLSSNLEEKPTSQDLSKVLDEFERVNDAPEIPSDVVAEKQKETREEYRSDEGVHSWEMMDKPAVVKANSSISRNEDWMTSGKEREARKEESSVEVVSLQSRLGQKLNIDHETPMTEGSAASGTKAVSQFISPGLSLRKAALRALGRPPPALSSSTEDDKAAREEPSFRFYIGRECMECKAKCPTSFIFKAPCSSGHKQQLCSTCLNYLFEQEFVSYRLKGQCLGFTFWKQSPREHSCGGVTIFFQDVRHLLSADVQKAWKIWAVESNSLICDSCGRLIAEHNIRTSKQKSEGTKTTTHGHCDSCEKDTCYVYQNIIDGHEMHKVSMGLEAD